MFTATVNLDTDALSRLHNKLLVSVVGGQRCDNYWRANATSIEWVELLLVVYVCEE